MLQKIHDTDVDFIPIDWKMAKLGTAVTKFVNGGTPSTKNNSYWSGKIPWITGADIVDQKIQSIRRHITHEALKKSSSNIVEKGNLILVTRTGVGKITIAPFDVAISQDITGVYTNKEIVVPEFLFHFFDFNQKLLQNQNQGTSIQGITRDTLSEISISIPAPEEQTAIATALSDTDALMENLEKLIEKKRNIKQGAIQELLKPKNGWSEKKLGDCLLRNPDYGLNAAAVPFNESLPVYIRITDITGGGRYSMENKVSVNNIFSSSYFLEEGDIVFARTGASVGKTYLYRAKDGKLVFAGFLIRIRTNPNILIPKYFQIYTQTAEYWSWIRSNSMRTGQPGINGNEYKELVFSIPPIKEQTYIAQILSDMDYEIETLEQKLQKYRMIKQGMMQVLLTGKIRLI